MTSYAATNRRRLPRGWAHLFGQIAIWLGFYVAYQLVRGRADQNIGKAFTDGQWVISTERHLGALVEPSLQGLVDGSTFLVRLTSYTYWLSQFAVVGLALLWVYFRHHERFYRFRNTLIVANLMGLLGYAIVPTAPPWMFPFEGFNDITANAHSSGLFASVANQYAAMPSLHSMDAIIVGLTMTALVRHRLAKLVWLLWAPWVWFTVMSTGNHYWLDVAAGVALAGVAHVIVKRVRMRPPVPAGR